MNIKRIILGMFLCLSIVSAWEVNTHRAIDREAIEISEKSNLGHFLQFSYNKQRGER